MQNPRRSRTDTQHHGEKLAAGEEELTRLLLSAGAWLIHVVLILSGIVLLDIIPGMTQDLAWTIVNLSYLTVSRGLETRWRLELTSVST